MSIATVVTRGYGSFGTISKIVTAGYDIGTLVPVLKKIVDRITVLINTYMTQAEGFSLDYGSINEYDPDSRTYPAIFYEYPEEESLDESFQVGDRYSQTTVLGFRVMMATGVDLEIITDRVIGDFNKLFAEFENDLKSNGLIDYSYIGTEKLKHEITAYPVGVQINYELKYRRIMDDIFGIDPTETPETYSGTTYSASTPIWNNIISSVETAIGNMTPGNGYQFDYGSIDEMDPDSRTWPAISLEYPEEEGLNENEYIAYKNTCEHDLMIKIVGETSTDLDKTALIYRSDFNKMFADNNTTFEGVGVKEIAYNGSELNYLTVKDYPMQITLQYKILFDRQKKNPYST